MATYKIRYSIPVCFEIEADNEDLAVQLGEQYLEEMTGADFRECADFDSVEEQA